MSVFDVEANNKGGNGEEFEIPPAGTHPAILIAMIDLGTQEVGRGDDARDARRVLLVWELTGEKMSGYKDRNHVIGRDFTLSFHEKASMRQWLERWRGAKFPDGQKFNLPAVLGKPCLLTVIQQKAKSSDRMYAKADGISNVPKGLTVPPAQNTPFAWTIDSGMPIPEQDWIPYIIGVPHKEVIERSPEWRAKHVGGAGHTTGAANTNGGTAPPYKPPVNNTTFTDEPPVTTPDTVMF